MFRVVGDVVMIVAISSGGFEWNWCSSWVGHVAINEIIKVGSQNLLMVFLFLGWFPLFNFLLEQVITCFKPFHVQVAVIVIQLIDEIQLFLNPFWIEVLPSCNPAVKQVRFMWQKTGELLQSDLLNVNLVLHLFLKHFLTAFSNLLFMPQTMNALLMLKLSPLFTLLKSVLNLS